MSYRITPSSERLRPYIRQYWALEHRVLAGAHYTQRIIPSGLPELILYLDHKPKSLTGNRSLEENFLLNGQQNDYYDILISEDLSLFSISFQPQGLSQFFALPLNELHNRDIPLRYLNKKLATELEARLSFSKSFDESVAIAEECFTKLLTTNQRHYEFQRISHCMEAIKQCEGQIAIGQLASEACLSRKQFERIFVDSIGLSPKQYLKIIRLQAAIYHKSRCEELTLTELACSNGYYDQSHFIRDFKTMTGLTPKQFFDQCETPTSDFFEEAVIR